MSNSYDSEKDNNAQNQENHIEVSDSQTAQQTTYNYDELLNQLKMKSAALLKASNLIEILQLELEVQKNSKKQAIFQAQNHIRQSYQIQISNLNNKIQILQSLLQKRNVSTPINTEFSHNQLSKRESRLLRRSCSKSLNRSVPKQNKNNAIHKKTVNPQISFENKMFRKMLVQSSIWDNQFVQDFNQLSRKQTQNIQMFIQSLTQYDDNFDHHFSDHTYKSIVFKTFEEFQFIIKKQNQIIMDMKIHQTQLQEIVRGFSSRIEGIVQDRVIYSKKILNRNQLNQITRQALQIISKWNRNNKLRQKKYSQQNKQLRQIVEEMILLVNKKRSQSSLSYKSRQN